MIDTYETISDLRAQLAQVETAIQALEEFARLESSRRGRPRKWHRSDDGNKGQTALTMTGKA